MTRKLCLLVLLSSTSLVQADVNFPIGKPQPTHKIQHVVYGELPPATATLCGGCSAPAASCKCESRGGVRGSDAGGPAAEFDDLAQPADFGDPLGAYSAAPQMIGDFFGGALRFIDSQGVNSGGHTIPGGGGDRQFKIVENMSPFPTDRFFFNYHHFTNPLVSGDGRPLNLDRFTFGLEKTMMDGMVSFEIRIPFASGLATVQNLRPLALADNEATQFGNIGFATKVLLVENSCFALSAGLGTTTPTADDSSLFDGTLRIAEIDNEAFHLQPFVGALARPSHRSWLIMFAQANFDANGNSVRFVNGDRGVIQDQSLLFLSAAYGFWLHRDDSCRYVRGIAPLLELHYSTTLQDSDRIATSDGDIANPFNRLDVVNITAGLRLQIGSNSFLTVSGVAPLRGDDENLFDSEFSLQYVRMR